MENNNKEVVSHQHSDQVAVHGAVAVKSDVLLIDEMGWELITLHVGEHRSPFTVHKNLLRGVGGEFKNLAEVDVKSYRSIAIPNAYPNAFKLLVEYLYTKQVPSVSRGGDPTQQGARLRGLIQLYCMLENMLSDYDLRNKVMDNIQDGFAIMDRFPQPPLIRTIFENTADDSRLRMFLVACITYQLCHYGLSYEEAHKDLRTVLKGNDVVFDQFLMSLRVFACINIDPRYRKCGGWDDYAEGVGRETPTEAMPSSSFRILAKAKSSGNDGASNDVHGNGGFKGLQAET